MLKPVERIIVWVVSVVSFLLSLILLGQQIEIIRGFRYSLNQARNAGLETGELKTIAALEQSSAVFFILAFLGLILIIAGTLLAIHRMNKAFELAEVKEKAKLNIRKAAPGLILTIFGCLLISFCFFSLSFREKDLSRMLVAFNNYKLMREGVNRQNMNFQPVIIDSLAGEEESGASAGFEMEEEAEKETPPSGRAERKADDAFISNSGPAVADFPEQPVRNERKENRDIGKQPTEEDYRWANDFLKKVVVYNYTPVKAEKEKYAWILKKRTYGQEAGIDGDLEWAFRLIQKTKNGYQPSPQEFERFEKIVGRSISENNPSATSP